MYILDCCSPLKIYFPFWWSDTYLTPGSSCCWVMSSDSSSEPPGKLKGIKNNISVKGITGQINFETEIWANYFDRSLLWKLTHFLIAWHISSCNIHPRPLLWNLWNIQTFKCQTSRTQLCIVSTGTVMERSLATRSPYEHITSRGSAACGSQSCPHPGPHGQCWTLKSKADSVSTLVTQKTI